MTPVFVHLLDVPSRRRLARPARVAAIALLLGAAACSEDYGSEPLGDECASDVTVSVTAGATPTFTWAPSCRVSALLVQRTTDLVPLWSIEPTGARGIAPGVVYGVLPSGAAEDSPAEPLDTGVSYRVVVGRGRGASQVIAGSKSFTP